MEQLEGWQKRRIDIVNKYIQGLGSIDGLILPGLKNGHAWHLFVIQLKTERWHISRNEFIEKMNGRGIGLAVHYKPIQDMARRGVMEGYFGGAFGNDGKTLRTYKSIMNDFEIEHYIHKLTK